MSLKIKQIEPGSWADDLGILPDEKVVSINGKRIKDFIDLQFYGAEESVNIEIKRLNGERKTWHLQNFWQKPLGITAEDHVCRQCVNNCIFCFIDQMPPGQRDTLYIKDDDVCFSFYYGNFITLTNLTEGDYKKIVEQYLSPLYISVHTTNRVLHKQMLRYSHDFDLMAKLRYFCENEIAFHTQIVVVPGYNDKEELRRTLADLDGLGHFCLSIGIVPVGLTRFRQSLPELRTVRAEEAAELLAIAAEYERTWCADEIYLKAGEEIPDFDYYEDYEQIENGIGMLRMMKNNWAENKEEFIDFAARIAKKLVFICGELAQAQITEIAQEINQKLNGKARVQSVVNHYFGETVTVTGLLTWQVKWQCLPVIVLIVKDTCWMESAGQRLLAGGEAE
jgi:putative radical SAM enzyme (TIGR03279 family)